MSVVVPHRAIEAVSTSTNPKQAILDFLGDISGFEIQGDRVLVGIYMRPEKTKGGIIRPDANKEEDVWQGKVGLILSMGPNAFVDLESGESYRQRLNVGDWCVFSIGDIKRITVNGFPCGSIRDTAIVARIDDPFMVL